ncbi:MAG: hypothetical protein ACP5H7_01430 [Minisyncoccia bacterium]
MKNKQFDISNIFQDQNKKVKGACAKAIFNYLKAKASEDDLKKIKEKIQSYGFNINLDNISPVKMYPIGLELAIIFSLSEVLNWKEKEIKELGRNVPKLSFIVKFFIKYLISLEKGYKSSPIYWKTHFNFGILETPEINKKEKYLILVLKDFSIHPLYCKFLEGYFETMAGFILGKRDVSCNETKCVYRGDNYHEFKIQW